jgi:hypothetical protein
MIPKRPWMSLRPGSERKNVPSPINTMVFDWPRADCLAKALIAYVR